MRCAAIVAALLVLAPTGAFAADKNGTSVLGSAFSSDSFGSKTAPQASGSPAKSGAGKTEPPNVLPPKTPAEMNNKKTIPQTAQIPSGISVKGAGAAISDYAGSMEQLVQSVVVTATKATDPVAAPSEKTAAVAEMKQLVMETQGQPEPVRSAVQTLTKSGNEKAAVEVAQAGLSANPGDPELTRFLDAHEKNAAAAATAKARVKELLAGLRENAGEPPPPGAAVEAGILPGSLAGPAGLSPANRAALAAGLSAAERAAGSEAVKQAVNKFRLGDDPSALTILDRRLTENPSDTPALRLRALVRRHAGDLTGSLSDARGVEALAPWDTRAKRLELDDLADLGRPAEALAAADEALAKSPNDPHVLAGRARVWESMGKTGQALADYRAAAAADAQFDSLYQDARARLSGPAAANAHPFRPRGDVVWLGALGTALLFFSFVLFRRRGDSSVRYAMRAEDHQLLARGARPDAAPQGFRILRTLGQGGMGVVYEALDEALQRPVALKKLRAEIADNPRERARFLKEARTVAALKHPNIVEIHAIHEGADGLFLVFEKVPGETLHERLDRGPLPPAETVAYLRQVAQALDHAHSHGVIHQDLKPANVMVTGGSAKVMDFGIARRVAETLATMSRIEVAGTPAYMAPEQESGGAVGPAADVFALGACAYELLVGKPPFPNGGMMMKAQRMYRPLAEVRPDLPPAADAALARALDPEPGLRWPSASSFVEAFARSLAA
jgi:tRNA A-37 threonylcarbamoyl transferase component Bud32